MKTSIETVHEVLANENLEPDQIRQILKRIEEQAAAEAEEERANREPPVKKQFAIVLSDPNGDMPEDKGFVGWVCQIPEDDPVADTTDRIIRAAHEFNISKKGRKYPVKSIGEACETVGPRFLKEQDVAVKTKVPVFVIVSDNKIPEPPSDLY